MHANNITTQIQATPPISAPTPIGRPRALDEIKLAQICSLISVGCGLEKAARYVGCAASTIRREARRNHEFAQQLRRASMASEMEAYRAIQRAASTHWRAAAWFINRTDTARPTRQPGNARRVRRRIARPWEPSERDQFISEVQSTIARTVTDNALLCQLVQQIQKLDAQTKSTDRKPTTRHAEIPSTQHQPEA
jgi:hypothetical protein